MKSNQTSRKPWTINGTLNQLKPIVIACALVTTWAVKAGDVNWTGNDSSDWNDPGNWSADPTGNSLNVNYYFGPNTPTMSSDQTIMPGSDVKIGEFGGPGQVDHLAGVATNGNLVLGWAGGTGTYNLADTTTTGGALTGFGTGSGTMDLTGAFILGSFLPQMVEPRRIILTPPAG